MLFTWARLLRPLATAVSHSARSPLTPQCRTATAAVCHRQQQFSTAVSHRTIAPPDAHTVEEREAAAEKEMASFNAEDARRLKILQMEYDVWYSFGRHVPAEITPTQWMEVFHHCPTSSSRLKYFAYLAKKEKYQLADLKKKEKKKVLHEQRQAEKQIRKEQGLDEPLNTFLLHIRETTMNHHYYHNIYHAMQHGPHLVFDFSFDEQMTKREVKQVGKQLAACHGANKPCRQPFHFHFCNLAPDSASAHSLHTCFPGYRDLPITTSQTSYLDHYDRDRLVYLSPNGETTLGALEPDDVYIVGGLVDLGQEQPVTYAKAKREGIRSARLPLDKYLKWRLGTKALTLDQVVKILLSLQHSPGDWDAALTFVPTRKVGTDDRR